MRCIAIEISADLACGAVCAVRSAGAQRGVSRRAASRVVVRCAAPPGGAVCSVVDDEEEEGADGTLGANLYWIDTTAIKDTLCRIEPWQRVNHFPGMSNLARKSRLAKNLARMWKLAPKEYSFFPRTWVLPADANDFRKQFDAEGKCTIEEACAGAIKWLDDHEHAEKDEFERKLKELQDTCTPVMQRAASAKAEPMAGEGGGAEPIIEEVD